MTPHPQAEILRAIADGEEIQAFYDRGWHDTVPRSAVQYLGGDMYPLRIKTKVININGIEVPEPMREMPPEGTSVYWPGFGPDSGDTHTESADVGCYPPCCPTCCVRDCCTSPKKLPPSTPMLCSHSQGESNVHRWT